ncbi:MAG: cation-translocating P-type ATPase [Deltaproteobacteria bacterium]|jgi:heavy metal translocating P-type ATPase|nr:cation-translocating P-type ATPase [Deltaproteobacteria bacterium]
MKVLGIITDKEKRHILCAMLGGVSLAFSFFWPSGLPPFPLDPAWVAIALCGLPILKGAVVGLATAFDIKADLLVGMALVAAVYIGEIFAAGEVAFIMSLGSLLEERTVRKAREGIEKLVNLTPRTARVLHAGIEEIIPAEEVRTGDTLRVLPGETIAVDGVITAGRTAVDQSLMTGESLPVDKDVEDEVFSGTVNQLGAFEMRAVKVGENSSLQRMIRLVESADASKTPVVRIMDRWATWIVVAAFATAIGTWIYTGEIIRAVTILVVFCPCALVLATPTAIMAGIGNATHFGVLISSGDALERLAKVTRVAFDKTGTLTHGKPEVVAARTFIPGWSAAQLLELAAGAEQRSEHPLGRAIIAYARKEGIALQDPQEFSTIPGRGVSALAGGRRVYAGTRQLMRENGLEPSAEIDAAAEQYRESGGTVVYFGVDGAIAGLIALSDTLRADAAETVSRLHAQGVLTTLLTGDNAQAAAAIGKAAGINQVRAELLPEDKVNIIRKEMRETGLGKVCMVGDGINDAPALKASYVGLAMGGVGSDIAVDAADAVLVRDDIKRLPQLIMLARKTAVTIKVNISLSMLLNIITVVLAALGLMGPVVGALAHNAGALFIVLNSARLLGWKYPCENKKAETAAWPAATVQS